MTRHLFILNRVIHFIELCENQLRLPPVKLHRPLRTDIEHAEYTAVTTDPMRTGTFVALRDDGTFTYFDCAGHPTQGLFRTGLAFDQFVQLAITDRYSDAIFWSQQTPEQTKNALQGLAQMDIEPMKEISAGAKDASESLRQAIDILLTTGEASDIRRQISHLSGAA